MVGRERRGEERRQRERKQRRKRRWREVKRVSQAVKEDRSTQKKIIN